MVKHPFQRRIRAEVEQNSLPASETWDTTLTAKTWLPMAASATGVPLLKHWWVGSLAILLLSIGTGAGAVKLLLHQPTNSTCSGVFWPFASASLRLYCAQELANQQTLEDLLAAIQLVEPLPQDHPLRPEINRRVELWAKQLLDLSEETFDAGELERAIKFAERVPKNTTAYALVKQRVEYWREVWTKAQAIYNKAAAALQGEDWRGAFSIAIRLLEVDNQYWAKTKFEELNQQILTAQMDESTLAKARDLIAAGSLTNLVEAMKLMRKIGPDSVFRKSAQALIVKTARTVLDLAQDALDRQDLQLALDAVEQIPQDVSLWDEAQDFVELAYATSWTWSGTVEGLQEAIAKVTAIAKDRPLYNKAQDLAARWQQGIEGVKLLASAQSLANTGTIASLSTAITQAQGISSDNFIYTEAQQEIRSWQEELQLLEDQPILDRAEAQALSGNRSALAAAIQTAQEIAAGRVLYAKAQNRIQDWRSQIQALDPPRPISTPVSAVATQPATPNFQDQRLLTEAQELAEQLTPITLASAIDIANQIPQGSPLRFEAEASIGRWGQQMLDLARQQMNSDVNAAIAIAQQVPRTAPAYQEAQRQIQTWRNQP